MWWLVFVHFTLHNPSFAVRNRLKICSCLGFYRHSVVGGAVFVLFRPFHVQLGFCLTLSRALDETAFEGPNGLFMDKLQLFSRYPLTVAK